MAGKRAAGGGRKPKGPFKGKTETLTTRITRNCAEVFNWKRIATVVRYLKKSSCG